MASKTNQIRNGFINIGLVKGAMFKKSQENKYGLSGVHDAPVEKPGKGLKGQNCNRMVCQSPGAIWYNISTRKWYCQDCAYRINEMGTICFLEHDIPEEEKKWMP